MNCWREKEEFKFRVLEWAVRLQVPIKILSLRRMKSKWASCSTSGNLTFNIELLDMERELGDYVIVHELLHFNVPNHGKLWKSLMRAYLGDYEVYEAELKRLAGRERS
ncbi:MAG: M48 family metallopeptidase [Deltaproteobacteria bacterium]|nr:M48 family metallopeptidase [Deltaproteobacteria bacterium]